MRPLWPHQEKALALCSAEFKAGHKAVVIVMSTGSGKTETAGAMSMRHLAKRPDGKVLFCAHREELVSQTYDAFTAMGLSCGVIQAKPTRVMNAYRPVQIASTQTLLARDILVEGVTLLVLDECHHYMSAQWYTLGDMYKKRGAYIVGLTATPIRGDGRGLGDERV